MKNNKIRTFRIKLCWEQTKLAKEIGVTRGTVSNWESGERNPSLSHLLALESIANKYGIKFNKDEFTRDK